MKLGAQTIANEYTPERIHFLRKILLTEFENILAVALPRNGRSDDADTQAADTEAPSLAEIAEGQLMIDTASNQMIRAIEEFMILTRTMKELWLFGELNTLASDQTEEEKTKLKQMEEDEAFVTQGMQEWLRRNSYKLHDESTGNLPQPMSEDENLPGD